MNNNGIDNDKLSTPSTSNTDNATVSDNGNDNDDDDDIFSNALNLEEQFHAEGYALGVADGTAAGLSEGRIFGLEKGFEKFVTMGKLAGRAAVWRARVPPSSSSPSSASVGADGAGTGDDSKGGEVSGSKGLPLPPVSERVMRQLERLEAATDARTLGMENSEEGVDEFDERLREAEAKATMIARALGEREEEDGEEGGSVAEEQGEGVASVSKRPATTATRKVRIKESASKASGAGEMEDFAGLPGAKKPQAG